MGRFTTLPLILQALEEVNSLKKLATLSGVCNIELKLDNSGLK